MITITTFTPDIIQTMLRRHQEQSTPHVLFLGTLTSDHLPYFIKTLESKKEHCILAFGIDQMEDWSAQKEVMRLLREHHAGASLFISNPIATEHDWTSKIQKRRNPPHDPSDSNSKPKGPSV